jgi:hypothetical protein
MNGPFDLAHSITPTAMPDEFEALAPPPLLLPGESLERYNSLRRAIFADLAPQSAIEWLLALDVAEISWEILRYRLLRHKLLEGFRHKAIEAALRRVDLAGIAPGFQDEAEYYTVQNALSWQVDPIAAAEIDSRLAAYGFDQDYINVEVYVQAREMFIVFEGLLNAAQLKRSIILKEIGNCRRPTNERYGRHLRGSVLRATEGSPRQRL